MWNCTNCYGETKIYTDIIVANHQIISLREQLCQNMDNSMMIRFNDTHSVKGISMILLALVLVSDFYYSTVSVLVVLWSRNVWETFYCVWFDWCMALPVTQVWYRYKQLHPTGTLQHQSSWHCDQHTRLSKGVQKAPRQDIFKPIWSSYDPLQAPGYRQGPLS